MFDNNWGGQPMGGGYPNYGGMNRMGGMAPRYQIVTVNGENGANRFEMGPGCSALLLDERDPIVWLVRTDGAGYKSVTPYSITPYQPVPPVDVNALENRIKKLEGIIYGKSDSANVGQQYDGRQCGAVPAADVPAVPGAYAGAQPGTASPGVHPAEQYPAGQGAGG